MKILIVVLLIVSVLLQGFMAAAVYFDRDRKTFREHREDREIAAEQRKEKRERERSELERDKVLRGVEEYDGSVRKR